jgi:UDP-N-acetylmuramoyl-tripeptide--D-alanyl-D-alanine ligase
MIFALFFLAIAYLFFAWRRMLTYLHIYQQDDYDSGRFVSWITSRRAFDRKASLCVLVLAFPALLLDFFAPIFVMVAALVLAVIGWVEVDPRLQGKKKLAMTARAARILWSSMLVLAFLTIIAVATKMTLLGWVLMIQLVPFALVAGNAILFPWESTVQKGFWNEAHAKLLTLKPFTVGITGSFGKTSTKHILAHVLAQFAPTLATPGSVNTPMGIARVVRETLTPHHKYFICEMGAYGPGSIKTLCDLAPPHAGVLTTIGRAHYERYKTLDAVARAKGELPEAAIANNGWAVMGSDVLDYEYTRHFIDANRGQVMLVGARMADDVRILDVSQTTEGVTAHVDWKGTTYTLFAPLYGINHAHNMAIAFATACKIGMDPYLVVEALKTTPQIRHRLEVIRQSSGAIVIDDAYNSNPAGFAAALETLTLLGANRRRILISPGMIELGDAHATEHARLGTLAAQHVDVFLPVSPVRILAMTEAFKYAGPHKQVVPCATFAQAQEWLSNNMRHDDIVLLENDLPDLYERKLNL